MREPWANLGKYGLNLRGLELHHSQLEQGAPNCFISRYVLLVPPIFTCYLARTQTLGRLWLTLGMRMSLRWSARSAGRPSSSVAFLFRMDPGRRQVGVVAVAVEKSSLPGQRVPSWRLRKMLGPSYVCN